MVGRQLPFFSLVIPAYLVVLYAGWRRMVEVWPAVLVAGGTFAIGQFTVSNFVGPELTDALSALFSLTAVALLLRVWQPAEEFTEGARLVVPATLGDPHGPRVGVATAVTGPDTPRRVFRAYATYGILIVTVLIGQIGNFAGMSTLAPPANVTALLKCGQGGNRLCPDPWVGASAVGRSAGLPFSGVGVQLARRVPAVRTESPPPLVQREAPVVAATSPYPLTYRLDFLAAAGTLVFIASLHRVHPDADGRSSAERARDDARQDRAATPAAGRHHRVHPVDRHGDELFGDDLVDGAGAGEDRRALSVLRGMARHDRRVPHRQRHLVQHALRTAAGDDGEAVGARSGADGRDEQFGGRDGKDDQPAEPLGRRGWRGRRRA